MKSHEDLPSTEIRGGILLEDRTPNKSSDRHGENGVSTVNVPYRLSSALESS